jgi:putative ABC transport system permease protein
MLKSYLKTAWRCLFKNKVLSLVNILGLSIGMGFAFLIGAYIWNELKVNAGIKNNNRIYLVQSKWRQADMGLDFTSLAPLGNALKENYPHLVEDAYQWDGITSIVSREGKYFKESMQLGTSNFIKMFGFKLLQGNPETALSEPYSLVITDKKAIKYFGKTDVVGEVLTIQSFSGTKQDFTITGVLQNLPFNTVTGIGAELNDFFLSDKSLPFFGRDKSFLSWQNPYLINYVQLRDGIRPEDLQGPVKQLLKLNTEEITQNNLKVYFTSLKDYYLESNGGVAKKMISVLSLVALFILVMAVINFINLTIGSAVTRLKEIGVRKVMGSSRKQLGFQFIIESIILAGVAVFFALLLYQLVYPVFIHLLGKEIPSLLSFPLAFLAVPLMSAFVIGIVCGIYPAFVLSGYASIDSLKGKLKTAKEKVIFRRSLIGFQFITAITVCIAAVVIGKQVAHFFNTKLGYDKDNLVTCSLPRDWSENGVTRMATIREELLALPQVANASFSFEIMDGRNGNIGTLYNPSKTEAEGIPMVALITDEKFADTYKVHMVAGSFFQRVGGNYDTAAIVINQAAAKSLGWKDANAAIGQQVKMQGSSDSYTIKGVTEDFHFSSLHEAIRPLFFTHVNTALIYRYMTFRLKQGDLIASMKAIQKKWAALFPEAPFEYKFMDDTLSKLYQTEIQMRKASLVATILAIIIVVFGVIGIVMQSISRRIKEVGIRKVLGASLIEVIFLFLKEFYIVIILANAIAWPISYLILNKWLQEYAYRIDIGIMPFIIVSISIGLFVSLIIAILSSKIALTSPVKNLRTE